MRNNAEDVERVILPALEQMSIAPAQLRALVLSHAHGDHSGGTEALVRHAPQLRILACAPEKYAVRVQSLKDREVLPDGIFVLHLPGHTADCAGLYDQRTHTLLLADALQWRGIGRYGCAVSYPEAYIETVGKIRSLAPDRILASHAYEPCGERAEGSGAVTCCLDSCLDALHEIAAFVMAQQTRDAVQITEAFRAQHPQWPRLPKNNC